MESKLGDNIDNSVIAQNLGTNQIFLPKNSVPAIPQPQVSAPVINNNIAPAALTVPEVQNNLTTVVSNNSYFNIFGVEISRNTLYIAIAFLVLIGIYYYYTKSNNTSKDKEEKKQKKSKKKVKSEDSSSENSE